MKKLDKRYIDVAVKAMILTGVIVAILYIIGIFIPSYGKFNKLDVLYGLDAKKDRYIEQLQSEQSDITGMTRYDKLVQGLNVEDGSDTDADGLTDKEEIEVYHSDPLKASTADDLYLDSYKVKNGMNVEEYYEYSEPEKYRNNTCNEIKLAANTATDFIASISDVTGKDSIDKKYGEILKEYYVYNFGGEIQIDATEILKNNDVKLSDVAVFITEGPFYHEKKSKLENCKFNNEDNILKLDGNFDSDKQYLVFVVKKSIFNFNAIIPVQSITTENKHQYETLTYGFPIAQLFTKEWYEIDYIESDYSEIAVNRTKEYFHDEKWLPKANPVSYIQLKTKSGILNNLFSFFKYNPDERNKFRFRNLIFIYFEYDSSVTMDADTNIEVDADSDVVVIEGKYHGLFDPYTDEFKFQNFGSYISEGNCAGISHLTAYLYNKKTLPSSGHYNITIDNGEDDLDMDVQWDITTDKANATLMDPGLWDYKDADFVNKKSAKNDNKLWTSNLTDGENEFLKMVGCFWRESNDQYDPSCYFRDGEYLDYSLVEKMKSYIDDDKILDFGFDMTKSNSAHAVNIYAYKEFSNGEVDFYIYDSNFPRNLYNGVAPDNTNGICKLQTMKFIDKAGNEKFTYIYWPYSSDDNYMTTSKPGYCDTHLFMVMDEDFNILNK